MKGKILYFAFSAIILLSAELFSRDVPFTILHFSDSHSYLLGTGEKNSNFEYLQGGLSRVATVIANIRSTDTNVLVYHSGDVFHRRFLF